MRSCSDRRDGWVVPDKSSRGGPDQSRDESTVTAVDEHSVALTRSYMSTERHVTDKNGRHGRGVACDPATGAGGDGGYTRRRGAVFYELFTGRPPFEGRPTGVIRQVESEQPTPPGKLADVPARLDEVLLTALATGRDQRYDAVVLLRNDLQELFGRS